MTRPPAGLSPEAVEARRGYIGGSDANRIMGGDDPAIQRLAEVKRGEREPDDLSRSFPVFLGVRTEEANRDWFALTTGRAMTTSDDPIFHPAVPWIAANVDGLTTAEDGSPAVFEAKHTGENTSWETLVTRYYAQIQHYLEVTGHRWAILSVIFGNARQDWVEVARDRDYIDVMLRRHATFWNCVQTGERWPGLLDEEIPDPTLPDRIRAAQPIYMGGDTQWLAFAARYLQVEGAAAQEKEIVTRIKDAAKAGMLPRDFREAWGGGMVVRQSANGAIRVQADDRPGPLRDDLQDDWTNLDAALRSMGGN